MCILCNLPQPRYCERTANSFFGEPLNLVTNLFFLGAAWFAWQKVRTAQVVHKAYLTFLVVMLAVLGLGSASYHAMPNSVTLLLDAIPVYVFLFSALVLLLKHLTSSWKWAAVWALGFAGMLIVVSVYVPASFLNGSVRHVATFALLLGLIVWCFRKYGRLAQRLLLVGGVYGLAIAARSLDNSICSALPIGTHFLWHAGVALSGYLAVSFLVQLEVQSIKRNSSQSTSPSQ